MTQIPPIPLSPVLSRLPPLHPKSPFDYNLAFGSIALIILTLSAPHTGGWKLFRAGIAAPISISVFGYIILCAEDVYDINHWGVAILMSTFMMRISEFFIFFPPEENCHRLVPKSRLHPTSTSHLETTATTTTAPRQDEKEEQEEQEVLTPEPVPQPFTLSKLYWATSLWFSYRGVGWNTVCPLGGSSRRHPYLRKSTRKSFIKHNIKIYILYYLIDDFFRAIRNIYSAPFFSGLPGSPTYDSLTQIERAINSTAVVVKVWFVLVNSHILWGMTCVIVGGILGWEGEMFTPWGWPPLFGDLHELWRYPGLSTMWSRTWQGYNRRWLYVLGWIGIGENVLGLTHTGISAHPTVPITTTSTSSSSANSLHTSGQTSPSHPIPTSSPRLPTRRMSSKLMIQNLIKSLITFLLSGLNHDVGSLALILKNHPKNQAVYLSDVMRLTPFFVLQPFALAVEALFKTLWRRLKSKSYMKGQEPTWLTFMERIIGFIWTWVWLGYTARYFVEGMAQLGVYRRDGVDREMFLSVWGGLIWGKWWI
ncbi:uncharacterized protein IL334_006558 [Kwoniella shivajii]|uniref:Wax synthase domain-containing protein n=1 Tax=Kwoniella shivajii TaxID=564305 RepID=A0ABZ1D6M4_9TREE|nr:hypothetical protein IL334_006558 [Kwoniella shivajii]